MHITHSCIPTQYYTCYWLANYHIEKKLNACLFIEMPWFWILKGNCMYYWKVWWKLFISFERMHAIIEMLCMKLVLDINWFCKECICILEKPFMLSVRIFINWVAAHIPRQCFSRDARLDRTLGPIFVSPSRRVKVGPVPLLILPSSLFWVFWYNDVFCNLCMLNRLCLTVQLVCNMSMWLSLI